MMIYQVQYSVFGPLGRLILGYTFRAALLQHLNNAHERAITASMSSDFECLQFLTLQDGAEVFAVVPVLQ